MRSSRPRPRVLSQGIALIIVMISIVVLSILAGGFAYSMKVETKLAQNANSEMELEWLGRSGVEYARWVLGEQMKCPLEPFDSLNQSWAGGSGGLCATNGNLLDVQHEIHIGNGSFTWRIVDLERKANINLANETMLQQALNLEGVGPGDSTPIVNSILDWIDPDDQTRIEGTETEWYQGQNPPYVAKNGLVDDLSELLLVRGVTPEIYWGTVSTNHPPRAYQPQAGLASHFASQSQPPAYDVGLADLFTPMSSGKINLNTASAAVLQVIPGIDATVAEAIVAGREGEDDGSGLLGPYRNVDQVRRVPEVTPLVLNMLRPFVDVRSWTFEVLVDADVAGYKRQFTAILRRNNPKDIQVLRFSWK
jgi:type II secretory pathway component PulK